MKSNEISKSFALAVVHHKSGDYIEISQVQVELGKVATPFEHRSYAEELALCQRYYYRIDGGDYTWINALTMRVNMPQEGKYYSLSGELDGDLSFQDVHNTITKVKEIME